MTKLLEELNELALDINESERDNSILIDAVHRLVDTTEPDQKLADIRVARKALDVLEKEANKLKTALKDFQRISGSVTNGYKADAIDFSDDKFNLYLKKDALRILIQATLKDGDLSVISVGSYPVGSAGTFKSVDKAIEFCKEIMNR